MSETFNCLKCGATNPAANKFCGQCAALKPSQQSEADAKAKAKAKEAAAKQPPPAKRQRRATEQTEMGVRFSEIQDVLRKMQDEPEDS